MEQEAFSYSESASPAAGVTVIRRCVVASSFAPEDRGYVEETRLKTRMLSGLNEKASGVRGFTRSPWGTHDTDHYTQACGLLAFAGITLTRRGPVTSPLAR